MDILQIKIEYNVMIIVIHMVIIMQFLYLEILALFLVLIELILLKLMNRIKKSNIVSLPENIVMVFIYIILILQIDLNVLNHVYSIKIVIRKYVQIQNNVMMRHLK